MQLTSSIRRSALALFVAALALPACEKAGAQTSSSSSPAPSGSAVPPGMRLVTITAGDGGFVPNSIPAVKGEDLVLRFTRTTESECLKAIELPSLGVKKDLPVKQPVDVVVKADKEGAIGFQCWMNMYKGKVNVAAPK